MDRYLARVAIRRTVQVHLKCFGGTVLDIGCGSKPYRELLHHDPSGMVRYIGVDLHGRDPAYQKPDITWDGKHIPLPNCFAGSVLLTEVLEHCSDPSVVLSEAYRLLRSGGFILATVPFLWPLHEIPHDWSRYTPFHLSTLFEQAGFAQVRVSALGGWDASLAQLIGLWVRRRPLSRLSRFALSVGLYPLFVLLSLIDKGPTEQFSEGVMYTGFAVSAYKL